MNKCPTCGGKVESWAGAGSGLTRTDLVYCENCGPFKPHRFVPVYARRYVSATDKSPRALVIRQAR